MDQNDKNSGFGGTGSGSPSGNTGSGSGSTSRGTTGGAGSSGAFGSQGGTGSTPRGTGAGGSSSGLSGSTGSSSSANRPGSSVGSQSSSASSADESGTEGTHGIFEMLEKIGVSQTQIDSVRASMKDANIEEALDKARVYVNDQITKARDYAKKNPGVVLGGLAGLVVGAGLLTAAMRKNRE